MSIELKIPNVGESIQEVQIGQWLKQEGDRVAHDETIVELETDKASMEMPAPIDGVISKIVKHDGESVAVGDVIAYLDPDGQARGQRHEAKVEGAAAAKAETREAAPRGCAREEPSQSPAEVPGPVKPSLRSRLEQPAAQASAHEEAAKQPEEQPAASPSVRRLLREHHLRAQDVEPTGRGGPAPARRRFAIRGRAPAQASREGTRGTGCRGSTPPEEMQATPVTERPPEKSAESVARESARPSSHRLRKPSGMSRKKSSP